MQGEVLPSATLWTHAVVTGGGCRPFSPGFLHFDRAQVSALYQVPAFSAFYAARRFASDFANSRYRIVVP